MRTTIVAVLVGVSVAIVAADELKVMSAGAVEPGLVKLIEQFKRSSGHAVQVEFGTGPQLTSRVQGGQMADVLIAPSAVMDQAVAAGKVNASTRKPVGRVGVGVAVRRGLATTPDVSTPDRLKAALLGADAVVFTRGSSGQYIDKMLTELGVAGAIAAKIVRAENGEALIERLIEGKGNDIGFGAISEIRQFEPKGVRLVAPLPNALQNFTAYDAAVMTATHTPKSAAEFVQFLATPAARTTFSAVGVQAPE
jgi:molybdate transport system substrate-binding protein